MCKKLSAPDESEPYDVCEDYIVFQKSVQFVLGKVFHSCFILIPKLYSL